MSSLSHHRGQMLSQHCHNRGHALNEGKKIGWRDFTQAVKVLWQYRAWRPEQTQEKK